MRRYTITLLLFLWFAHLFGNDGIPNPRLFLKKVYFPVIETPAIFKSRIHGNDYLVFIEYSDSLNVKGHYMALEEAEADTLPFRLEARKRNARLYYNGKKETFRPRVSSMDSQHAKGYARLSVLGAASFQFDIYEAPEFQDFENSRYQDTVFVVDEISDIPYAKAMGFWSELGDETDVTSKIFQMKQAISEISLDLKLDIFLPQDDTLQKRPLVMLVHGGAFYFGSKDDKSITQWCRHLASKGYVAASIDYRIGFLPTMISIGRAGYRAVQDAHAAMRFLVAHQEEYGIDTSMLFVGGCSAGAITTLNLAFMTNETRPEYTHSGFLKPDLGDIDTCGNAIKTNFRIKGIVDMWGAMPDTTLMRGRDIPILAFHGDADDIVPYDYNYPFGIAGLLKTMLVEKMYGSSCIVERAIKLGHKAQLVTFSGYKHSPHVEPATKELNDNFFIIQDMMSDFFYNIVVPEKPEIVEEYSYYHLEPEPLATSWQVEGGIILYERENFVDVRWFNNAPKRSITVSATMPYGIGFNTTKTIN
jgi:pimeloyl-ACP methyl ester carboxylesterase